MSGDVHVRFCEGLGVKLPGATHPIWNTLDLERKLAEFQNYYNVERVHSSLDGTTPCGFATGEVTKLAELDAVRWRSHCRGLVRLPMAA